MTELLGVKIAMNAWVVFPLVVLAAAVFAYFLNIILLRILRRAVEKTSTEIDDRIYRLLERYLFLLLVVGGLLIILDAVPLPPKILRATYRLLALSGLLLAIFLLTKGALLVIRNMEAYYDPIRNIKGAIELVTKIVFLAVGAMIVLDNLGISLTPLLTTLGIGSLAVAIALQDTLGNLFAGLYIKADRPIEIGHYVRLESGEEGYVDNRRETKYTKARGSPTVPLANIIIPDDLGLAVALAPPTTPVTATASGGR